MPPAGAGAFAAGYRPIGVRGGMPVVGRGGMRTECGGAGFDADDDGVVCEE
jgi:hypothetical protein